MTQIKDMAEANKTFVKSIKTLSEQMEVANTIEVQKIFDKFDVEVEKANMMAEEIQDQLNVQESKYKKEEISEIKVTDSEIDTLIYGNKTLQASTSSVTDPLEKKLEELKAKIEKK
jgi:TATA-box binding protein (TBP) (component of TFIID and TFIIIB)